MNQGDSRLLQKTSDILLERLTVGEDSIVNSKWHRPAHASRCQKQLVLCVSLMAYAISDYFSTQPTLPLPYWQVESKAR